MEQDIVGLWLFAFVKLKLDKLRRIGLFFLVFNFSVLYLSAQSGYSNLEFVENKGQWDTAIKFRAQMSSGAFFLRNGGFTVVLHDTADLIRIHHFLHGESVGPANAGPTVKTASTSTGKEPSPPPHDGGGGGWGSQTYTLHSHLYNVSFENSNPNPEIVVEKVQPNYNNYLIGKDPSKWKQHVQIYLGVTFKNIYDGIDVHYYTNDGVLKYDIIVHPGADPSQIILNYEGQDQLILKKNQLSVKTSVSTVKELEPRSYQVDNNGRTALPCNYVLRDGHRVSFNVKNRVSDALLVIDPSEIFCTFTGSRSDNWGYTSTYDNAGAFYAGGIAIDYGSRASGDLFGTTAGAFQEHFQGGDGSEGSISSTGLNFDVAIMKFTTDGKHAVYATYLGGSGDEQPHSMICDAQGDLIITGRTTSQNFPTYPVGSVLPRSGQGDFDLFVTKLNAAGSFPIGSQKIGGTGDDGVNYSPKYVNFPKGGTQDLRLNYGDDGRGEVMLDAANNIFVVTCTKSTDFPMRGAFQGANAGGQDGVIIKLDPNVSTLMASSYFGGSSSDALFSIAISPTDNSLYVTGGTMSTNLPGVVGGVVGTSNHGGVDGVIARIKDNGGSLSLLTTSYFGTSSTDMIYGVQVDAKGFPYITGTTYSVITPVNSPFNTSSGQATGKQFITKLKPDLTGIVYSANFGPGGSGFPNISPTAFLVDRCENVYVSGWGGGIGPGEGYNQAKTTGLTPTSGAIKPQTDGDDFYFFVLQKNAASQLYGSFFGQPGGVLGDHVDGGTSRFDKQGVIYQSICANCYGPVNIFPVTANVAFPRNGTGTDGCNEAAVKIAFNFAGISAGLKLSLSGRGDTLGCAPLTVHLADTVHRAKSYVWNFGDGTPDSAATSNTAIHTYLNVGLYRVMLIGIDSNTCNIRDTVYQNITVKDNRASVDFDYALAGVCGSFSYNFFNLSQPLGASQPFSDTAFTWIFDGHVIPGAKVTDVEQYKFPSAGTYNVSLILVDTSYCNAPDTLTKQLYIATDVVAKIGTPLTGCAPYMAHFENNSLGGQTYLWEFDDGTTSTDRTPPDHLFPDPGPHLVKLTVTDPATCNVTSSTSVTITLLAKPSGDFSTTPVPPTANTPTVFSPTSSPDANKWEWLFGDGASTVKTSLDTVAHQYQKTDTFKACLVIFNNAGCSDTVCHPVAAIVNPLLDVPNAFTPGRFGQNSIIKVAGFGISRMNFSIFNRWGQKVFQSVSPDIGWDGMYKGALQPMDVYAYTLEAEFFDGTHVTRKGDITLIR